MHEEPYWYRDLPYEDRKKFAQVEADRHHAPPIVHILETPQVRIERAPSWVKILKVMGACILAFAIGMAWAIPAACVLGGAP